MRQPFLRLSVIAILAGGAILLPLLLRRDSDPRRSLVVYCAHDSVFADEIIRKFEQATGISVDVRYDEEASKSLGLTNLLLSERASPRCDVFWNNQTLGTIRLRKEGILAACEPSLFARIPEAFRDSDHHWAGFAARLRVMIVNTERMPATEEAVEKALEGSDLTKAAIAVPLFGTTLTHYTVIAGQTGMADLQRWHQSLRDRGIREVRGNGAVKDLVAEGGCDFGFTDSDDAFAAIDDHKPVAMVPVRLSDGQTVCIPNSVAMIRNCPHPTEAGEFIRFLLSEETELALALSRSRQIPLGTVNQEQLPADVVQLAAWARESVSPATGSEHDQAVLEWLTREYTGQATP